jgi:DNA-directed RNA polymerase subunit alpha
MPGAAITDVTIDGISHEYSTIEGVKGRCYRYIVKP